MKNTAGIIPVSSPDCQAISWKKILKTAFSSSKALVDYLELPKNHSLGISSASDFPVRVPLPYAKKMEKGNCQDPLLLQVLARNIEQQQIIGFSKDPLKEQTDNLPGMLHKYHGRVLLLLTGACAVNCRYCFRRHFPYESQTINNQNINNILKYIQADQTITEVILSGGDPLLASDSYLAQLITKIESISHIKRLRIHTRLPVVIPQRLTEQLRSMLSRSKLQTSLVVHINHPNEMDLELGNKLQTFIQAGITVLNQSVLLKDVNDDALVLAELSEKLFQFQVIPYYVHLLDSVDGAAHFDVSKERALKLFKQLARILPGYLLPKLAQEEPNASSKTVLI